MDVFDAKCKFQELTRSTGSSPNLSIPGRIRVCSLFYTRASPNTNGNREVISMYSGSDDTGDLLYSHWDEISQFAPSVPCLTFPDDGLLFPDGLFVKSGNGSASDQHFFGCITIIYTGG
jgi:hypothetical protein